MTRITFAIGASIAALAIATPAAAQRVDGIVAFGDSYADDGNLFELLGIPRPAAYPNGRFSNGTNFVDTMSLLLGAPVENFAIGGAFTNNGNINGPGIPGFTTEWQSFLAGGGPAAFPRTDGRFDPGDLLVISIGGNDARAYRLGGGTVAGASAAAAPRIAEATNGLNALVNAGARNITFLAGDVGRLPEAVGQPSAAAGSAFSSAFNQGMQTTLAGYANQGVIVNYLDLNLIGDRVIANPAAYGLTSSGASTPADVAAGRADQFLFYADNVHLSSAGFAIVGRYAVRQLEAPLHLEAQADLGLQAATSFGKTLLGRLNLSGARMGKADGGPLNVFISANTQTITRGATLTRLGYDMDTTSISGGLEYDLGYGVVAGAAVNVLRGRAGMDIGSGRAKTRGWQVGGYAGWSGGGGFFAQAYGGYGSLDYRIQRDAVIDDITARPDGETISAGAQAGYLFPMGDAFRVGPVVGVQYAKAKIDGFTESGDPVLTLNVGKQSAKSLIGSAGIEARGNMEVGGLSVQPYGSIALAKEFEDDDRTILYANTSAPGIVNRWGVAGGSRDLHGRFNAGVNMALVKSVSLQLNATGSIARDEGNDLGGSLAVKVGF